MRAEPRAADTAICPAIFADSALRALSAASTAVLLALPLAAAAHSPICFCFENDDDTIICEGGFSDGASAEGVAIRVLDDRERVLIDGEMDENSEFVFARPGGGFHVLFDAGEGHTVIVFEDEIE